MSIQQTILRSLPKYKAKVSSLESLIEMISEDLSFVVTDLKNIIQKGQWFYFDVVSEESSQSY